MHPFQLDRNSGGSTAHATTDSGAPLRSFLFALVLINELPQWGKEP